jgi:uncharacterized membrane protein
MNKMMRLRNDFTAGLAVLLPLAVTLAVLDFILKALNRRLLEPIVRTFERYIIGPYATIAAKIIILFLIFMGVMLIGMAARILLFRRFFSFFEGLLLKIPIASRIYRGTKEFSKAYLGEGKAVFRKVAVIEYPRKGVYSIGFVTKMGAKKEIVGDDERKFISVFVPTTPNPTSGVFIVVPEEDAKILDMSIEDGFKLIVSAGAV